jgi:hypothetical protein
MSKGYCNHSCKHFKYENVYETFEEKNSNGEVVIRWREYKGRKYYCDKCNDNYLAFIKEYDKNYRHKTSKWMSENVSMECYEPTETTQLLDGMVSDLNELLENIKNNKL